MNVCPRRLATLHGTFTSLALRVATFDVCGIPIIDSALEREPCSMQTSDRSGP